jgi:mRNA interferase RelE/StbE
MPEALDDIARLDGSQKREAEKAIFKVSQNPLPQREGGYGVELGNKAGLNLSGCLKIRLKKAGIRVVYQLKREKGRMVIVIIGMRAELEVYREAVKRLGMQ